MRSLVGFLLVALLVVPQLVSAEGLDARDLVSLDRMSSLQVSPDGTRAVFVRRTTDLEANRGRTDLWMIDADGSDLRRLTSHEAGDWNPLWTPDGASILFLSSRGGDAQVWRISLGGGEAERITDIEGGVGNLVLSPTGTHIAYSINVYVDCGTLECTRTRQAEIEESGVSGQVYDKMFVRHWDHWRDGTRSHLFVQAVEGGEPVDVTAGMDADVPSSPFGGPEEVHFSPDGKTIVFAARVSGAEEPWSTDFDLYSAMIDGTGDPVCITEANTAWDTQPVFSPDGSMLAYLAMSRPGYEADRFRIVLRNMKDGSERVLTEDWDRSAGSIFFSPDQKTLYTTASDVGQVSLFSIDVATGEVKRLVSDGHVRSPGLAGDRILFGRDDLASPVDLYSVALDGSDLRRLTSLNEERLAGIEMGEYEQFEFAGWNDETVHAYVVKPANFDPKKKYPLAFLVHGGPQGSFGNDFHYRWNPQTYAGAGYAAVMVDFHGSVGYGQAFTDSINGDWGGKPLVDLQKGLAAALKRYSWIDGDRACALGASYGGFMMNWIAGQWPDGFRCLVNHDGVFDQRMMYFATEELWFPEWEHGGPYWKNAEAFERHNPALYVDQWKTPMLVVHGALDYRVPETQGLGAFTALQRQGIPSKMLFYPDENHWVLQPANSIQWHDTVLEWLGEWTAEGDG